MQCLQPPKGLIDNTVDVYFRFAETGLVLLNSTSTSFVSCS